MQSQQLLTESQIFKDEVLPGFESADHPPKEMPERHDHGKTLIEKVRIEPCAKSFILWVYNDLATHTGWNFVCASRALEAADLASVLVPKRALKQTAMIAVLI